MEIILRPYRKTDREFVDEICYLTGFAGQSLQNKPYFPDRKLFSLIFCDYYLQFEPEFCFVAEDNGRVVGYIIGTPDSQSQVKSFNRKMIPRILLRLLSITFWKYPSAFKRVLEFMRLEQEDEEEELLSSYPAHLHINLHPDIQGRGIGGKLLQMFETKLKEKGITGLHLGTSNYNHHALTFYEKHGFSIYSRTPTLFWKELENMESIIFIKSI
ncbi:MAG: GNAT family N-acetyltransferase [Candidatus Heimdallarchaeota archaeon]|nr:GNAT family N-acetyltransferase [Candidatus Heimdallarchaeota archaeon]